jgi:apolipoprotein N-acyltransferase
MAEITIRQEKQNVMLFGEKTPGGKIFRQLYECKISSRKRNAIQGYEKQSFQTLQ